jgi:uncharacterized protein HemY
MAWIRNLLVLAVLALAAPALGQATDDATRSAARTLGYQGVDAYQAGDYAAAVVKLERAYAAVKVPTVGLWLARALAKTGRLVEASERYAEVMRLAVTEGQVGSRRATTTASSSHWSTPGCSPNRCPS